MSNFQVILDSWTNQGRATDVKTFTEIVAKLQSEQPQIYDNLVSESIRPFPLEMVMEAFLLLGTTATASELVSALIDVRNRNPRHGPPRDEAQDQRLGHAQTRRKLEEWLRSSSSAFPTSRRGRASPIVDRLLAMRAEEINLLLSDQPLTKVVPGEPKSRTVWSCFQKGQEDPFYGVDRTTLEVVRRLGLGRNSPTEEHLIWIHELRSGQTARWPTAIDAADYPYYRPGGRTAALSPPPNGLDEVVHGALYGRDLAGPIESTG